MPGLPKMNRSTATAAASVTTASCEPRTRRAGTAITTPTALAASDPEDQRERERHVGGGGEPREHEASGPGECCLGERHLTGEPGQQHQREADDRHDHRRDDAEAVGPSVRTSADDHGDYGDRRHGTGRHRGTNAGGRLGASAPARVGHPLAEQEQSHDDDDQRDDVVDARRRPVGPPRLGGEIGELGLHCPERQTGADRERRPTTAGRAGLQRGRERRYSEYVVESSVVEGAASIATAPVRRCAERPNSPPASSCGE